MCISIVILHSCLHGVHVLREALVIRLLYVSYESLDIVHKYEVSDLSYSPSSARMSDIFILSTAHFLPLLHIV